MMVTLTTFGVSISKTILILRRFKGYYDQISKKIFDSAEEDTFQYIFTALVRRHDQTFSHLLYIFLAPEFLRATRIVLPFVKTISHRFQAII